MRWILVFIFLYLIPLIILFKNYKKFSRACIYACTYVVLATTIAICNMYISGVRKLENNNSIVMNYREIYTSNLNKDYIKQDLSKIKRYKSDIIGIEDIALNPIKQCGIYKEEFELDLGNLDEIKNDIDKAKYMCERTIEIYDDMEVPELSKSEYTQVLKNCTKYMKEAYEWKYKAIDEVYKIVNNEKATDFIDVKNYIKQSDKKINQYKKEITELENKIKNK